MSSTYDLNITQGSKVSITFTLTDSGGNPIDLTEHFVNGAIRLRYSDTIPLVILSPSISDPKTSGIVSLSLTSAETAALPVGMAVYDIERFKGPYDVQKVISGKVFIHPEATI